MKAYRVKIVLEDVKPPVWRRCLLPSLLDFRQLDELLKVLWGWQSGGKTCFFLPYHDVEVDTDEKIYEEPSSTWRFSFKRAWAADVRLGDYFDEAEWLRYWFALRTDNQRTLKLLVEETVEVQGLNPPVVLKARGAAPAEGPGGLWQVPSGVRARESYLQEAELTRLNEALAPFKPARRPSGWQPEKEPWQSTWEVVNELGKWLGGKSNREVIKTVMNGEKWELELRREHLPGSEDSPPEARKMQEKGTGTLRTLPPAPEWPMRNSAAERRIIPLREILSAMPEEQVRQFAEQQAFWELKELKGRQLRKAVCRLLLRQERLDACLCLLPIGELRVLERIIDRDGSKLRQNSDECGGLEACGYLFRRSDDVHIVPLEVQERYLELKGSREYPELHRRYEWLYECLNAASCLYMLYPPRQLEKLLALEPSLMPPKGTDLADLATCLPQVFLPVSLWADGQLTSCDTEEDLDLLEEIFDCEIEDFYLPRSAKEIRQGTSWLLVDAAGRSLRQRLLKLMGKVLRDKEECRAQFVCIMTFASQMEFTEDGWEELMDTFLPWENFSRSSRREILRLVMKLREHVRSPQLGGWSPAELALQQGAAESSGPLESVAGAPVVELEAFRARAGRKK